MPSFVYAFWSGQHTRPDFYLSGTRPDSTISDTHQDFYLFGTRPNSTLSGTHPYFYFFGTCSDSTLSRYLLRTFSGTLPNSTFPTLAGILPFMVLTLQPFPVLARTLLRSLPGFPHLLRHRPRISLSFLALCPDHSSSQALYLVFFKSFSRSNSIPLAFNTK